MSNNYNDKSEHVVELGFDSEALVERWGQTLEQVKGACKLANKNNVTLLAVSKTKPAPMIATLAEQGQRHFGENYLQEALEKIEVLKNESKTSDIVWHYIGSIQRNKTRDIAENFDWVQTLERDIIAKRLNEQRPENMGALNVLIQINIDNEDSKSGCLPSELPELVTAIKNYEQLCLRGLMIIPSKTDTDAFKRTKTLFNEIKEAHPELIAWDTLSMGMSGDMAEAIASGSTMVRVGTAIFGARD
ncbi:YggS family pyridoxal phosphate-dependent enzyme [Psychrobacter sp. DM8]|uniref:YggS family pyridoxal phosphate-dependent enzyme n=1 Tax=unclassified Psychrobacter TaxID=196806 RepID=UPI003F4FF1BB